LKLINRLEEIFKNLINIDNFDKKSTIKELLDEVIVKDELKEEYYEEVYILLKAMINAAKSDGTIDADEQKKVMEFMGDMSKIEQMFVEQEMIQTLELDNFLKEVPKGMEEQVYYMSLFAIDLDVDAERAYLEKLAKGLNLSDEKINRIHESLDSKTVA
jgi:uncharacterized membrane protein YebE (DUF533 family)